MTKELKECITAFEQEAKRLSIPLDREQFERDITVWLPHRADASLRIEKWMAWGHSVDIRLKFVPFAAEKYYCEAEVSWSSTGRSVSMALAAIKLYERATELAALAECIFSGFSMPKKEEAEKLVVSPAEH